MAFCLLSDLIEMHACSGCPAIEQEGRLKRRKAINNAKHNENKKLRISILKSRHTESLTPGSGLSFTDPFGGNPSFIEKEV